MKVVVIGHGGHSKVITEAILSNDDYEIVGYLDDKYEGVSLVGNIIYGPLLSAITLVDHFYDINFVIAIGNNEIRKEIVRKLNFSDNRYVTIIHQSAVVSPTSKIGVGTVVMPNSVINADSEIGKHTIINTGAIVEHDSEISNFCHIAPRATLTGDVQLEEGVSIGAGATVIPGVTIGSWSTIGAGAVVINQIPSYCTAVGIPAKVKKVKKGELID
ncbi:acetyltransferase [Neobacillus cucumis]|uniref:acetyltransferase n=1 Tax=Neobacillus cucumis TaxID=1740721 RepID=UPI00196488B3|nr:acetyltransferase [Neobacillus cucumis]MBM7651857.1 acetyltransferase EpsM [Neobacillus cucumis]